MLRSLSVVVALVVAGAAQNGPKTEPPSYNVQFTVEDGTAYVGTTTFEVNAKGVVTGQMRLTEPVGVTALLGGTVKDGTWTFEYTFAIADQNCTGTLSGTAKVPADRKVISGQGTVSGGCVQQPVGTTFTFTRQEK